MFSSCLVKPCRVFMAKLTRPTKLTLLKQVESCSQFITIFFFFWAASHREVHHGRPGSLLTQQGRVSASVRIWWSVDRPKSELMCP